VWCGEDGSEVKVGDEKGLRGQTQELAVCVLAAWRVTPTLQYTTYPPSCITLCVCKVTLR
jgi:hypothetical protein